jgi:hypothetical protein
MVRQKEIEAFRELRAEQKEIEAFRQQEEGDYGELAEGDRQRLRWS